MAARAMSTIAKTAVGWRPPVAPVFAVVGDAVAAAPGAELPLVAADDGGSVTGGALGLEVASGSPVTGSTWVKLAHRF
jgi:hypothetical protein